MAELEVGSSNRRANHDIVDGARLNVIEGRLAIIERHTGLVKA